MSSDFTIKEIVIETNNTVAKLADELRASHIVIDRRLDSLEQHKSSIVSNFKLLAWIFAASVSIASVIIAVL